MGVLVARSNRCEAPAGSLVFVTNASDDNEYARLNTLPDGFGDAEFTFEIRIRADNTIGTGDTSTQDSENQRTLWSSNNNGLYSASDWWFAGNFLLDGHNNAQFFSGTFSIQIVNSGRVRWLFGDGSAADARLGDLHACQGSTSILDGSAHTITCVRRNDGGSGSILELYLDGVLEDTETTTARTNMATTYWDSWTGYPSSPSQIGWFFGAEKQACLNILNQYEDFKDRIGEIRFWNVARSAAQIFGARSATIDINAPGLVGVYRLAESGGSTCADWKGSGGSIVLNNGGLGQTIARAGGLY